MAFFKDPEVEKKYKNLNGESDRDVRVAIQYQGKLSGVSMAIADKIFSGGGHLALKTEKDIEKPNVPEKEKVK